MADIYRSPSLENKELEALYGEDGDCYFDKDEDEDCISEVRKVIKIINCT